MTWNSKTNRRLPRSFFAGRGSGNWHAKPGYRRQLYRRHFPETRHQRRTCRFPGFGSLRCFIRRRWKSRLPILNPELISHCLCDFAYRHGVFRFYSGPTQNAVQHKSVGPLSLFRLDCAVVIGINTLQHDLHPLHSHLLHGLGGHSTHSTHWPHTCHASTHAAHWPHATAHATHTPHASTHTSAHAAVHSTTHTATHSAHASHATSAILAAISTAWTALSHVLCRRNRHKHE